MRILAIRGCNLASLAGEFEIDLAHGALGMAGVFAIVGPTGAGKSTLLDAMCVALFDRTPRLANRSTVVVGRGDDALGAQDVRTLLRRGASQGWAEVDFESGDARRYRARWSVRRARGATDGRFQSQQVTLTSIDGGEQLGGTKTETLEAIHQRLGLSFDQFRRSALLAQGEFAAFLRADGRDRSELLERMTGTEIYSRLSIAAHHKAALAEQRLRERQGVALAIAVLSDDARARTERDLALAKQAQEAARVRLAAAEAAARWLAEAERRRLALAAAEQARHEAELAVDGAAVARAELALRRRAEALRPTWQAVVRLERQLAVASGDVVTAGEGAVRAEAARDEVAARRARFGELHAPIREARIAAGLVERSAPAGDRLEARAQTAAADAAWLLARRGLAPAVAGWRELDAKLAQQAMLVTEIAAADRALDDHAQRRKHLVTQRAAAVSEQQRAVGHLAEAQAEAAGFQQKRGLSLDAARRQEDEARRRCSDFEQLAALATESRTAVTARADLDRQLGELADAAAADAEQRRAHERDRELAGVLKSERTRTVEELRKAAGYAHARAELVDGEPCPLCGAEEHPWHDRGSFDALVGDAQARLAEAVLQGDAAVAALATLAAREHHRAVEQARVQTLRAKAEAAAAAAQTGWRAQLATLGELLLVDDPAGTEAQQLAAERLEAARGKLESARAARSQVEAVAKAGADAQARVQTRQLEVEHHAQKVREHDSAIATLDAAVERVRGERAGKLERQAELRAAIATALGLWLDDSLAAAERRTLEQARDGGDLVRCRRMLGELVTAWTRRADVIGDVDAALSSAIAAIELAAREAERAVADQIARRDAATSRRDALATELAEASAQLETARVTAGFDRDELRRLLADEPGRADALAVELEAVDRAAERARTLVTERRRLVEDHAAARVAAIVDGDAERTSELAAQVASADHHAAALAAALAADADARARRERALAELAAAEHAAEIDRVLGQVIGSHDGKLFRSFAQSLTLDGLLAVANSHLEELAPRYQLERVPKHDLELQVIDRDLGDEVRSVQSLSGGESFLVSLALALGLSSMSAHDVRVRTLLIDEGFGTLDPATLDSALAVLDALQATGRQVGVISHVPALVERVGAHVRVSPKGAGRSEVVVAQA